VNTHRFSNSVRTLATGFGLVALLLASTPAVSQKKGHKEAEKFKGQTTATRNAVEKGRDQLQQTLDLYNQLFETPEKKLSSVYGKLTKSLEGCDKAVKDVEKNVDGMKNQAEKFFASWDAEIKGYSSETMQEKSRGRLDQARGHYDGMLASMSEAGDLYDPFVDNLREQVLFLGRDLSPEVLEDLKGEAAELNASAEVFFAKIDEILTGEVAGEKEVDEIVAEDEAAMEGETEAVDEDEGATDGEEAAGDDAGGDATEAEAGEEESP